MRSPMPQVPGGLTLMPIALMPMTLMFMASCGLGPLEYQEPTIVPGQAGEPFDASGVYAYKQVLQKYVDTPTGQATQATIAYTLGSLQPGDRDGTYMWQDQVCLMEMTDIYSMHFTLDDGYYDNITPPVMLEIDPQVGGLIRAAQQVEVRGAHLEDPVNDPLPTDSTDPRVYDYDFNDDPGYTLWVEGFPSGYVWVVQRYVYALEGASYSRDAFSGLVDGYSELVSLFSSNELIPIETDTEPDTGSDSDYFEMIRVSADTTCGEVLEQRATLFTL